MTYETIQSIYKSHKDGITVKELQSEHLTASNVINTILSVYKTVTTVFELEREKLLKDHGETKLKNNQSEKKYLELEKLVIDYEKIIDKDVKLELDASNEKIAHLKTELKMSQARLDRRVELNRELMFKIYQVPSFIRYFFEER